MAGTTRVDSGYWKNLLSVGAKTDASGTVLEEVGWISEACEGPSHCIRIEWSPFVEESGTAISQYAIYRNTIDSFELTAPIATTTEPYYVDSDTLTEGGVYYYKVAAVIAGGLTWGEPGIPSFRVIKPPPNSSFVHRWMVNLEMCTLMGLEVGSENGSDPMNDYRCKYQGFGSKNVNGESFYDFNKNLVVDRFELGCKYTKGSCSSHDPGDASSTTDCIGMTDPAGGISGPINSVFYQRATSKCWLNTDGGTSWTVFNSLSTPAARLAVSSNSAGLPPIARLSATVAKDFCEARSLTIDGSSKSLRLPWRTETIAYMAWPDDVTDPVSIESGLGVDGSCNVDYGHSQTFDSTYPPLNADTLAGSSSRKVFVTGSNSTRNCVTRYGIQDAIGNFSEWTSSQSKQLDAVPSLLDPNNYDFAGIRFDGVLGPAQVSFVGITTMPYYSIPLGLPIKCDSGCSSDDMRVTTASLASYGDGYAVNTASSVERAALSGGLWADGDKAGRFTFGFDQAYTAAAFNAAIRCVAEVD